MNEKFFDLKKEKQDRIINAALKVFAENGYKRASTDEIVKEAGISKGLLFHYFISKQGLYEFLFDYSAKYMMLEQSMLATNKGTDYFEIWLQLLGVRAQVMKNYPYMQLFLTNSVLEQGAELSVDLFDKIAAFAEYSQSFFVQVDDSLFVEPKAAPKVKKMTELTINGLLKEQFNEEVFDAEKYYKLISDYLQTLKKLSYR
ncbi:MAG: TetR/AcrR family transcriptional regulator [Lachnospiraceae bacterium]|nr:TetR/AcrR family transcriptional regulator [Lachnospiraceae bacterium]MBR3683965.1 TetR/AcrR family transcriptional regulator [Lachnospiraceae bacterium]